VGRDALSAYLVEAAECLAKGQVSAAYDLFLQAVTMAPADPKCHLGLAQTHFQLGSYQKAIVSSQEVLRLDGTCWHASLVIADALAAMGLWGRAMDRYNGILSEGVESAFVHLGLGIALQRVGRLAESRAQFLAVTRIEPHSPAGYCNLGNTLLAMAERNGAIAMYQRAIALDPRNAVLHSNLANAFLTNLEFKSAEECSRQALALHLDLSAAHGNLAEALRGQGRYGEAIKHYALHGTPEAAAKLVECHLILGELDEFETVLTQQREIGADNIRLSAISTFAALQHGTKFDPEFCARPLEYVAIQNLQEMLAPFDKFSEELLREAGKLDSVWEPPSKSTRGGSQTDGNLFSLATPQIMRFQKTLQHCVVKYFEFHAHRSDRFVTRRPKELALAGWVVRLRQAGRQEAHIHPGGWLSGVCYLRLPPRTSAEEGAIEFTLSGYDYPTGEITVPVLQHRPEVGDLVLFPSSLFHRTVAFSADSERISIAFDLLSPR
jgi:Flp pilus assembly protein TadD